MTDITIDYGCQKDTIENYMQKDKELAKAILEAFSKLYIYDKYLISNKPKIELENDKTFIGLNHHVGERSIVFCFAYYLQKILDERNLYTDYNLDCEYNRNGYGPKFIDSLGKNVYPDLIIHKRGSNDNNLLIMEFKTYWNLNQKEDINKIKAFINENNVYKYKYGIAVLIGKNKVNLKLIKNNSISVDDRTYK